MEKFQYYTSRIILGILFVFSGFVKSVEPMGTYIKLEDYFASFGVGFLDFLAPLLSIVLPVFELLLGMMLITGLLKKLTSILTLVFMIFFTAITLVIYIFNPVTDCGCFGDFMILTNSQTFFKNVFFLTISVILYRVSRTMARPEGWEYRYLLMPFIVCLAIPLHAYISHPAIEFLPYKVGVNIRDLISNKSENKEPLMLYKNRQTSENREFKLSDSEWQDTTKWEFIELIDNSKHETVVSFDILDESGENIATEIINSRDTTLIFVARDINNLSKYVSKVKDIDSFTSKLGYKSIVVTSSSLDKSRDLLKSVGVIIPVYNMDEVMIKSLLRSRAGVVIVGGAVILSKNNLRTMPQIESQCDLKELFHKQAEKKKVFATFYILILVLIFVLTTVKKRKDEKE